MEKRHTDIRPHVKKIVFAENANGVKFDFGGYDISYMFSGFYNLEEIDFSGVKDGGSYVRNVKGLFYNCSSLTSVDLSWMKSDETTYEMQDMFNGCSQLEEVRLNNPEFKTRTSTLEDNYSLTSTGGVQMQRMFAGCDNLRYVDMSNITIYGRTNWTQVEKMFKDLNSLEEVYFHNTKFPNVTHFNSMFENCESLRIVEFTSDEGEQVAPNAVYMTNMFKNCSSLDSLDLSHFGKLEWIANMNGLLENCTSLRTLNIDHLDNSHIGPTGNAHSVWEDDSRTNNNITSQVGCSEYGRDLGLNTCTSLQTLSAQNSNVWMCKNNRGLPGSEYFDASSEDAMYYFTRNQMTFQPDAAEGLTVEIKTKRNYVDLLTDRDGNPENMPSFDGPEDIADRATNINIIYGDLNLNGAGHLPAGVYTISDSEWIEHEVTPEKESYYRITNIITDEWGDVRWLPDEIRWGDSFLDDIYSGPVVVNEKLILRYYTFEDEDGNWHDALQLNTVNQEWPASGDYEIDMGESPLVFTYYDAALDVNGKRHNVSIAINKVTFKNLERFPAKPDSYIEHNDNHYYDEYGNNEYFRPVLRVVSGERLTFMNYAYKGDPYDWPEDPQNPSYSHYRILTNGSGTEVEYTVTIDNANPNTTFVFNCNDLDIPATQAWETYEDHCYDKLTINDVTYGRHGESVILGEGNHLETVTFAENTGLTVVDGNHVVTTGSDPSTSWSEFAVLADATGAKYTWVSGIACTSYGPRDTKPLTIGRVAINPTVRKEFDGTLESGQFEFHLELLEPEDDEELTTSVPNVPQTKSNDESGLVVFDPIILEKIEEKEDESEYEDEYWDRWGFIDYPERYYPGTNPDNNYGTMGEGEHNRFTYRFKVKEIIPDPRDPQIVYDETEHTLTVKVRTPEDEELAKGILAEFFLDGSEVPFDSVWSKVDTIVNLATFVNRKDNVTVAVNKFWDDKEDVDGVRPSDVSVQLLRDGVPSGDPVTLDESNSWQAVFPDLPKYRDRANLTEYTYNVLETDIPAHYDAEYNISTNNDTTTVSITNRHTPDSVLVRVTKFWNDHNNNDLYRPGSITVHLVDAGDTLATRTLSGSATGNEWEADFGRWPRRRHGAEIVYDLREEEFPSSAQYPDPTVERVNTDDETLYRIRLTNTHPLDSIDLSVTKRWEDNNNTEHLRTDIQVQLFRNNTENPSPFDPEHIDEAGNYYWTPVGEPKTIAVGNSTATWLRMPLYHNGVKFHYAVKELTVPAGYKASYSDQGILDETHDYAVTITNKHVQPVTAAGIPAVQKKLIGRPWLVADTFVMALIPARSTQPMPATVDTVDAIVYAPLAITRDSTFISDSVRQGVFAPITFTMADMDGSAEKTFTYHIRELTAAEAGLARLTGITYASERYEVDITVKEVDNALVIDKVEYYPVTTANGAEIRQDEVDIPVFVNRYNDSVTIYRLVADKQLTIIGMEDTLATGDYRFVLRPAGANAAAAPMPAETVGSGDGRSLTVTNEGNAIRFYDDSRTDDGLVFSYLQLTASGFSDDELRDGVEFEYELHEVIPEGCTFNRDGTATWSRSVTREDGLMVDEIYDAVVHYRSISVTMEELGGRIILHVVGSEDSHHTDYYLDNGDTMSLEPAIHAQRHGSGGVPIFRNARIARIALPVEKFWDDFNNALGTRPETVTVTLLANGEATDSVAVLDEANGWSHTFQNIPAVTPRGGYITYSVEETPVSHYETTQAGNMADGFYVLNTLTSYGEDEQCAIIVDRDQLNPCSETPCPATVTDADGNSYAVVKVDGYCWMAENLRTLTPEAKGYVSTLSPDLAANVGAFGYLYTWHDAAGSTDTPERIGGYVRGICPVGWHLPTVAEINVLRTNTAEELSSTDLWAVANGTNASGFNALPAGYYNGNLQRFEGLHSSTWFHGDTPQSVFHISYHCCSVFPNLESHQSAFSVRCVKDCE